MIQQGDLVANTYARLVLDDTMALERTVREITKVKSSLFLDREGFVGIPDGPVIGYKRVGGRFQVDIYQNGGDPAKTSYLFDMLIAKVNRDGA